MKFIESIHRFVVARLCCPICSRTRSNGSYFLSFFRFSLSICSSVTHPHCTLCSVDSLSPTFNVLISANEMIKTNNYMPTFMHRGFRNGDERKSRISLKITDSCHSNGSYWYDMHKYKRAKIFNSCSEGSGSGGGGMLLLTATKQKRFG